MSRTALKESAAASRAHYQRNREAISARRRAAYWADPEKHRARARLSMRGRHVPKPKEQRACQLCDKPFEAKNVRQLNCSPKCGSRVRGIQGYGLTVAEYRTLIGDGKCFLCQRNIKKWHVDHNHQTLETRGVICSRCNKWLVAGTGGDAEVARRLVDYIENPPARRIDGQPRFTRESFHRDRRDGGWQRHQRRTQTDSEREHSNGEV